MCWGGVCWNSSVYMGVEVRGAGILSHLLPVQLVLGPGSPRSGLLRAGVPSASRLCAGPFCCCFEAPVLLSWEFLLKPPAFFAWLGPGSQSGLSMFATLR